MRKLALLLLIALIPFAFAEEELPDDLLYRLTLNGEVIDVTLDGGASPFAARMGRSGTLLLVPAGDADAWDVPSDALTSLSAMGVTALWLRIGEATWTIETEEAALPLMDAVWRVKEDGVSIQLNGGAAVWTREGDD